MMSWYNFWDSRGQNSQQGYKFRFLRVVKIFGMLRTGDWSTSYSEYVIRRTCTSYDVN